MWDNAVTRGKDDRVRGETRLVGRVSVGGATAENRQSLVVCGIVMEFPSNGKFRNAFFQAADWLFIVAGAHELHETLAPVFAGIKREFPYCAEVFPSEDSTVFRIFNTRQLRWKSSTVR